MQVKFATILLVAFVSGKVFDMPDNGASMNLAQTFTPPADIRHDTSLVDGWRFIKSNVTGAEQESFDDQSWAVVSIPHTWNALDGQDGGAHAWSRSHAGRNPARRIARGPEKREH